MNASKILPVLALGSLGALAVCAPVVGQAPPAETNDDSLGPDDLLPLGVFTGEPVGSVDVFVIGKYVRGVTLDGIRLRATIKRDWGHEGNPWLDDWSSRPFPFKIEGTLTGPVNPAVLADCPHLDKLHTTTFKGEFVGPSKIKGTFVQREYRQKNGKHECVPRNPHDEPFQLINWHARWDLLEKTWQDIAEGVQDALDAPKQLGEEVNDTRESRELRDFRNDPFGKTAESLADQYHDRN